MNDPGHDHAGAPGAPDQFQTTRWSLLLALRDGNVAEAHAALAALCAAYWYPLYAFVRRKGHDAEDAQDVVQGFFAGLLEKGDLALVDRSKGKFRSFLMVACTHYMANAAERARAGKRGGGRTPIPIDRLTAEDRYGAEPAHSLTPERLFERRWALTLLDHVFDELEAELARAGKAHQFEALRPALLGEAERVPYARIGASLGVSEEAARAAAHRLRRRYRALLREEVTRTVSDPADVDDEIASLFAAIGG